MRPLVDLVLRHAAGIVGKPEQARQRCRDDDPGRSEVAIGHADARGGHREVGLLLLLAQLLGLRLELHHQPRVLVHHPRLRAERRGEHACPRRRRRGHRSSRSAPASRRRERARQSARREMNGRADATPADRAPPDRRPDWCPRRPRGSRRHDEPDGPGSATSCRLSSSASASSRPTDTRSSNRWPSSLMRPTPAMRAWVMSRAAAATWRRSAAGSRSAISRCECSSSSARRRSPVSRSARRVSSPLRVVSDIGERTR